MLAHHLDHLFQPNTFQNQVFNSKFPTTFSLHFGWSRFFYLPHFSSTILGKFPCEEIERCKLNMLNWNSFCRSLPSLKSVWITFGGFRSYLPQSFSLRFFLAFLTCITTIIYSFSWRCSKIISLPSLLFGFLFFEHVYLSFLPKQCVEHLGFLR